MKFREETIAKALHGALTQRLHDSSTVLSVEGAGVHWQCTAQRGASTCHANCFASNGAEYLAEFTRNSQLVAWGRTSSQADTINAIEDWLRGCEFSELAARWPFVDQNRRVLLQIQAAITSRFSPLAAVESHLHHDICDIYHLRFQKGERSCKISFYSKNEFPDAVFYWDECELFRFNADNPGSLATVVNRWVGEQALPSQMKAEFSWLVLGKLAEAYENGTPIEGEWMQSWDYLEQFYTESHHPLAAEIKHFIAQMRAHGYDKTLRAGQSMWTLILSRSRRHGLAANQSCIRFDFQANGMGTRTNFDDEPQTHPLELTPEVDALLQNLVSQNID